MSVVPMEDTAPALRIEGDFTVAAAATLRGQLLDAVGADSGPLTLDLAEVQVIDSAGLQLLLATQRSLAAGGRALRLQHVPAPVREALELFQLRPLLDSAAEPDPTAEGAAA